MTKFLKRVIVDCWNCMNTRSYQAGAFESVSLKCALVKWQEYLHIWADLLLEKRLLFIFNVFICLMPIHNCLVQWQAFSCCCCLPNVNLSMSYLSCSLVDFANLQSSFVMLIKRDQGANCWHIFHLFLNIHIVDI